MRHKRSRNHRPAAHSGVAVVEMAVCLPVLTLVTLATIESSTMMKVAQHHPRHQNYCSRQLTRYQRAGLPNGGGPPFFSELSAIVAICYEPTRCLLW
ncbi:MAG: TadE family protein [Bythopirellula sp.]